MLNKLMYIQWKDHWTRGTGWVSTDDVEKNPKDYQIELVDSVGWCFKETDDAVWITPVKASDDHRLEVCIIKSCITKKQVLSFPTKKKTKAK